MEAFHAGIVREFMHAEGKDIHVLGIEDIYIPFEKGLIATLTLKLGQVLPEVAEAIKGQCSWSTN